MTIAVEHVNKLIHENSPYLLQHAHNPVNWYPWCEEAFVKAQQEDKPIFLSIGYSTCHWCHVMEKESFEDEEVAEILNKNYISIKVDREERPDIDSVYMKFCQAYSGSGGWPLSILMTPDKKPFFAATYIPKHSKYGLAGFVELLESIKETWEFKKEEVLNAGNSAQDALRRSEKLDIKAVDEDKFIDSVMRNLYTIADFKYGGFGDKPKFPAPHNLLFLLRYWKKSNNENLLKHVEKTLESMYRGGIYDHIGFGFSRYSVDEKWLVPHFEKMLYDNALLSYTYCEAYEATKDPLYKKFTEDIFTYILRDMTSPDGGFYSAEDADSEGVEGKFYVFSPDEVKSALGEEDGERYCKLYDITEKGNFEGKNIPNLINSTMSELTNHEIDNLREKLYRFRAKRVHPFKDDKILTSWNGLMIASLAHAGRVFHNKDYVIQAEKAAKFILDNLSNHEGRLFARYRNEETINLGILDDYSFFIWGLIELYLSNFKTLYLEKAITLTDKMLELFWDEDSHGFFLYGKDSEELIVRPKELYDGAIPSGNSAAVYTLLQLYKITGIDKYLDISEEFFKAFGGKAEEAPTAYTFYASSLMTKNTPGSQIILCGDVENEDIQNMLRVCNKTYDPFRIVLVNDGDEKLKYLCPMLSDKTQIDCKTTAYVCKNYSCQKPITCADELEKILSE
ncbi:thioredoxin domain-containing protein [Oceanirhabdus sp. W0125-5]|uniref:thioredoxin domain-containing protein n=1 Tax=Oceanirhabdus sp. W0125-5 TaxID=2999116 RepID=UPI0022F31449|nr:thioredoxin domain-containing protein [Oceanirhabdus sp. W0125-5]WBW98620.1 thioredoxin domain-containing protein [Oceanirhabdus sp. W0125-5]